MIFNNISSTVLRRGKFWCSGTGFEDCNPEGFPSCDNYSCAIFAAAASLLINLLSSQMPREENFALLAHIQVICFRRNLTEVCKGM